MLRHFGDDPSQGHTPKSSLLLTSLGYLYGTTEQGGAHDAGVVYRVRPNGTGYAVLHHFEADTEGGFPTAGLMEASNGMLYGATAVGGTEGGGSIYRIADNGSGFEVLQQLGGEDDGGGSYSVTTPTEDFGGIIYGTASVGGSFGGGLVFSMALDGSGFQVQRQLGWNFSAPSTPRGDLLLLDNGTIVFSTLNGGQSRDGTVATLDPKDSSVIATHEFSQHGEGVAWPLANLLETRDGHLVGTGGRGGLYQFGAVFRANKDMTEVDILHDFGSVPDDGETPSTAMIEGGDGRFFGVTPYGGTDGSGVLYSLAPTSGEYQVLHRFRANSDGSGPFGGPILWDNDWLIGSTLLAGPANAGTLYRIRTDGSDFQVIKVFGGQTDGNAPLGDLVLSADGEIYGVTAQGGLFGMGCVYRAHVTDQSYQVLHHFGIIPGDGAVPRAGLTLGRDGKLYGTCASGGASDAGVVFCLNPDGSEYDIIQHLNTTPESPFLVTSALVQWSDGLFYGTSNFGGAFEGGTVFSVDPDGGEMKILVDFEPRSSNEHTPVGGLMLASDGSLYGTCSQGGPTDSGSVFRLTREAIGVITITSIQRGGENMVIVEGMGDPNTDYSLLGAATLDEDAAWESLGIERADPEGIWRFETPWALDPSTRFYRAMRVE